MDFARNRLFHGATVAGTELGLLRDHGGITLAECTEAAGRAAHVAIFESVVPLVGGERPIQMYEAEHLLSLNVGAQIAGVVPHKGPGEHPPLPTVQIKIQSGFPAL